MSFYEESIQRTRKQIDKQIESILKNKNDSDLTKRRFLVEIKQVLDSNEQCVASCKGDSECLEECSHQISDLRESIQNIKSSTKSWKPYYLPCVQELLDDETTEYLRKVNAEISDRTHYGVREEVADTNSVRIHWSNHAQKWTHIPKIVKKGEQVRLDANQVLIPYDRKLGHDRIGHAVSCANIHPLYAFSFEAKHRGQVPFLSGTLAWALHRIEEEKLKREREKHI